MKIKKIILVTICLTILIGCSNKEITDAIKFKEEYEKYNNKLTELEIDENNIVTYAPKDKINKIINSGTGVIFIGTPKDNLSRCAINILLQAADSTDLNVIYYIDSLDDIEGLEKIEDLKIPIVINVLEGKIISYHIGTIDSKETLTEDEELELYNTYTNGIHEVLQDACDERC